MTNADFIRDALGLLGVLRVAQTVSPSQGEQALRVMNDLGFEWDARGLNLQYSAQSDINDECPFDETVQGAAKANLAVMLAPYYTRTVSPEILAIASAGYDRLCREAALAARKRARMTNLPLAEGRRRGWRGGNIISGD